MRAVHLMRTVPMGIAGLILLPVVHLSAESIYHWKDRNGISCYSNTNIPAGAAELSVMSATAPSAPKTEAPGPGGTANGGVDDEKAADDPGPAPGSRAAALRARIEHRRTSIRHIENLLNAYPEDSGLRNNLDRKKQYLHEDLIHLELLEN